MGSHQNAFPFKVVTFNISFWQKKGNKIKLIDSITSGLTRRENKAITNIVDVFRGKYKNGIDDVAVKRVCLDMVKPEDDFRRLRHENVVKLLYAESDRKFRYEKAIR